tara:strand:- start:784 stop:1251 length:468 start_codon:yes stop_codon:yes gene_type:complete
MNLPKQIKSERNIELFNLLPKSFISSIETKRRHTKQRVFVHFHKDLEYSLQPSFSQYRVQSELGEDALSLSYIAKFVNVKVDEEWTLIKPEKYHTDKDINHTNGISFRLVDENSSSMAQKEYNYSQILPVVNILKRMELCNMISTTRTGVIESEV